MYSKRTTLLFLVVLAYGITQGLSRFEFTNVKCTSKDQKFIEFDHCYIKSINRSYKYISLKTRFYILPLNEGTASLQILRRFQVHMPITMKVTVDLCNYLSSKKGKLNPMFALFADATKKYTNLNHSCPYNHDIVVDKLPTSYLSSHFSDVLPLPPGDYFLQSSWFHNGIERATVGIYSTIS